jgi:hypothetical protein
LTLKVEYWPYSLLTIEYNTKNSLGFEVSFDSNLLRCKGQNDLREDSVYPGHAYRREEDSLLEKVFGVLQMPNFYLEGPS